MRHCKVFVEGLLLLLILGVLPVYLFWQITREPKKPLPAEAQKVKELHDKIELEMTEQDVDTLLAGYEASTQSVARDEDLRGRPLLRTTTPVSPAVWCGRTRPAWCHTTRPRPSRPRKRRAVPPTRPS